MKLQIFIIKRFMCFPDVIIALASILSDSKKLDSVNTLRYTLEIQISEL